MYASSVITCVRMMIFEYLSIFHLGGSKQRASLALGPNKLYIDSLVFSNWTHPLYDLDKGFI